MLKRLRTPLVAAAMVCVSTPALAYLDPGTGSMIVQVIVGALAAAALSVKLAWQRIKYGFLSMIGRKHAEKSDEKRQEP